MQVPVTARTVGVCGRPCPGCPPSRRSGGSARSAGAGRGGGGANGHARDGDDAGAPTPPPPAASPKKAPSAGLTNGRAEAAGVAPRAPTPSATPDPVPSLTWSAQAFPSYLQSEADDFCADWEAALAKAERQAVTTTAGDDSDSDGGVGGGGGGYPPLSPAAALAAAAKASARGTGAVAADDPVWLAMRTEAAADAADEPLLSSFLYASVLSHKTFGRALAFVLANRLADATLLATELMAVFEGVMKEEPAIERAALADVVAVRERDPACTGFASAFLHFKGYHAIQAHRVSHALWLRGQRVMARALQSRCAEVFAVDIHPAARIGSGILLDHGTGVVIGETAVVGNHVSLMQNVTLGGTGKDAGDRHPRIGDNVLVGAGATVLGAIDVGKGAQVAAGSLVLKPVAPHTMVAGSPAAVVGVVHGNPAHRMQQWLQTLDAKKTPSWDAAVCVEEAASGSAGPAVGAAERKAGGSDDADARAVRALYEAGAAKAASVVPPPRPAVKAAPPPVAVPARPPARHARAPAPAAVAKAPGKAKKPAGPEPEFFI